jgi:hypothetical protein
MSDAAWDLALVIVSDETRATAIAAAMTRGERVTLSALPLSAHGADISLAWRQQGATTEPAALDPDVSAILDRLGDVVRTALERYEWDWGDRPPASFASWLAAHLRRLRDTPPTSP